MGDSWYTKTSQWRKVRSQVLERDAHLCQIRGPKCTMDATQVDHIIPVEDGGPVYDTDNLRAACQWCNSWRAIMQKRDEGWRRSTTRIILVAGPPTAGKTTYIRDHAGPHDLVIDYDKMVNVMQGASMEDVNAIRGVLLRRVRRGEVTAPRVWIHTTNPKAEDVFPHHEVIVLDPGRAEVLERAKKERPPHIVEFIERWYDQRGTGGRRAW